MSRVCTELQSRYFEWCDCEMERMAAMLDHKVRKTPDNHLFKEWKEPKVSVSELLDKCRNRIDFLQVLMDENGGEKIEKRLESQKGFIKAFEQVLSDCMT